MTFSGVMGVIGQGLLGVVLPGLATYLAGQAVAILNRTLKKQGLELSAAQEARVRQAVVDVINRIEEASRRQKMTPDQKRIAATDGILREIGDVLPEGAAVPSRDDVGKMIDSVLPTVRAASEPTPLVVVSDAPAA
jgi:hypothetical protein